MPRRKRSCSPQIAAKISSLGHRSIRVAREKDQEVEDLGFDRNPFACFAKLEVGGVEFEVAEADHMRRGGVRPEVDAIGLNRSADVLHRLFAKRYEPHRHIGTDMVMDLLRQHDAAWLRDAFETGRHIDAIAVDVVSVDDHVTEVKADPKLQSVHPVRHAVA